ncbi:excisionase family DNA-binding protein [Nocardioides cynanchi]|uniref:excisionase family DNA-binding protein n=1 Tax=Nocardioides cynanchi TaxID=2558918 RepID=UPI002357DB72|nr:excisionase family DNA-binding protein [Nocardioides cynanchi]
MTERDEQIGRNVLVLRGSTTQQAVADAMRERGWKWSQATVWSVEKGERPLRLAEAEDLAEVFGVPMQRLTAQLATVAIDRTLRKCATAYTEVLAAASRFLDRTTDLHLEIADAAGPAIDELRRELQHAEDHLRSLDREIGERLNVLAAAYTAEADRAVVEGVVAAYSAPDGAHELSSNRGEGLSVADVAAMMRGSKMDVYHLIHSGELPSVRVGRAFRVAKQDVEEYLRRSDSGEDVS